METETGLEHSQVITRDRNLIAKLGLLSTLATYAIGLLAGFTAANFGWIAGTSIGVLTTATLTAITKITTAYLGLGSSDKRTVQKK